MTTGLLLSVLLVAQGDTAAINRYVQSELERQHIPGLSLAVLAGDRVLLSRGYGFANVELHVPASDSTVYQSGLHIWARRLRTLVTHAPRVLLEGELP